MEWITDPAMHTLMIHIYTMTLIMKHSDAQMHTDTHTHRVTSWGRDLTQQMGSPCCVLAERAATWGQSLKVFLWRRLTLSHTQTQKHNTGQIRTNLNSHSYWGTLHTHAHLSFSISVVFTDNKSKVSLAIRGLVSIWVKGRKNVRANLANESLLPNCTSRGQWLLS